MGDLISRKRIRLELGESTMPKKYRDFCLRVIDSEELSPTVNILRKCCGVYTRYNKKLKVLESHEFKDGGFHGWGVEYEELDQGVGNYTVGIVELKNGDVITTIPENIHFNMGELED